MARAFLSWLCIGCVSGFFVRLPHNNYRHDPTVLDPHSSHRRSSAGSTTSTTGVWGAVDGPHIVADGGSGTATLPLAPHHNHVHHSHRLTDAVDVAQFVSKLKLVASRRQRVDGKDRTVMVSTVVDRLEVLDDEQFSDCVWSMGILRCRMADLEAHDSAPRHDRDSTPQRFWGRVTRMSTSVDHVALIRLAIGFDKLGVRWGDLPVVTQTALLSLVQHGADGNGAFPLRSSREVATVLFTLGQLGVRKEYLAGGDVQHILDVVTGFCSTEADGVNGDSDGDGEDEVAVGQAGNCDDDEDGGENAQPEALLEPLSWPSSTSSSSSSSSSPPTAFSSRGLVNALHGLARMGVSWAEDLTSDTQAALMNFAVVLAPGMRSDELCSLLQSMALMKAPWRALPAGQRAALLGALEGRAKQLSVRELSNALWALGKLNVDYSPELPPSLKALLLDELTECLDRMKLFDLESALVGLGLMQVPFDTLRAETQDVLLQSVERALDKMNIFCLHNVLWGLARMGADRSDLGPDLTAAMLRRVLHVLHTFLPEQYGDVVWSLGTLGVRKDDDFSPVATDRFLAVLSRVYGGLHVRAGAYTLWGLNKMGFVWADLKSAARSVEGGREAPPLADSVSKFLRQRVASMREHDYSVLLYSLGGLGARLVQDSPDFPAAVVEKVHHRVTRVGAFLGARSLANALLGLSKCGARWADLPPATQDAWEQAMHTDGNSGDGEPRRGVAGMVSVEFAQVMSGCGLMRVPWATLSDATRTLLLREAARRYAAGELDDPQHLCTTLWGLSAMGCPADRVPADLLAAVRPLLHDTDKRRAVLAAEAAAAWCLPLHDDAPRVPLDGVVVRR